MYKDSPPVGIFAELRGRVMRAKPLHQAPSGGQQCSGGAPRGLRTKRDSAVSVDCTITASALAEPVIPGLCTVGSEL